MALLGRVKHTAPVGVNGTANPGRHTCAGMPYPQNVATAVEVEDIIRSHGATPATIAIMDGRVCVGLDGSQLEALGKLGREARKCSRCVDGAMPLLDGGNV